MNRSWRRRSGASVLLGLLLISPALAAEPTTEPLLRLETSMHTARIGRITTDAAGRWAVTASNDKTARVWEVASGRLVQVLRPPQDHGDEGKLYAVALSPDGATVALGGWTQFNDGKNELASDGHPIYLFDRASGRQLRRMPGLPNVVNHLAYSPDGLWLAASLGEKNGVRLFDATSGTETGRDTDYGAASYSAHFSSDNRRLVTTCWDGQVRLYTVEAGSLRLLKATKLEGGSAPFAARFAPDSRTIAVGFDDSRVVQVLDASTLAEIARPSITGVENGDLFTIAWSADGRFLLAGGTWDVGGKNPVRRWAVGTWTQYRDLPLANDTVMDLAPLPDGGLLFATADPTWGVLDRAGQIRHRQDGTLADLREPHGLRLSADGRRVRFGYLWKGQAQDARVFDVASHSLSADEPSLPAARTEAPGLTMEQWKSSTTPHLNGRPVQLEPYEMSRSLAIAVDGRSFVLGADWTLRRYDHTGQELWQKPVPGAAWAVNLSTDGRYVVAGYGDGTIRWHRVTDGQELLAFFPHADRQRWIAWTPEGYFDASPGAEDLIGYHLNRGRDQAGEFVQARQLWETFYQPGLIAHRLDADGDTRLAEMVKQHGAFGNYSPSRRRSWNCSQAQTSHAMAATGSSSASSKLGRAPVGWSFGWTGRNWPGVGRRRPSLRVGWWICRWIWPLARAR